MSIPKMTELSSAQSQQVSFADFLSCLESRIEQLLHMTSGNAKEMLLIIRSQLLQVSIGPVYSSDRALNWLRLVDPQLVSELTKRHPELSLTELKICVLLKQHLSTKEISELLCISPRSVENHRYRLRKKLGLQRQLSVCSYLQIVGGATHMEGSNTHIYSQYEVNN